MRTGWGARMRARCASWGRLSLLILCLPVLLGGLSHAAHGAPSRVLPAVHTSPAGPPRARAWAASADLADETLLRDPLTHRIVLVWSGERHSLNSSATLTALGFDGGAVIKLPTTSFEALPAGHDLRLRLAHGLVYPLSPIDAGPARLSLSTPSAAPGASVVLTGAGFGPNEPVRISSAGTVSTLLVTATGSLRTAVTVPQNATPGSILRIYAYGTTSHTFQVEPLSIVAPAPAPTLTAQPVAGGALLVAGAGFGPGERVDLFFAQGAAALEVTADSGGSFGNAQLAIPANDAQRRHSLIAYGQVSKQFVAITVSPSAGSDAGVGSQIGAGLSLNRYTVGPGSLILISCRNFAPRELVTVRLDGLAVLSSMTDANGAFADAGYTLPTTIAAGSHTLVAVGGASGRRARTSLLVRTSEPVLTLPSAGPTVAPGSSIAVQGRGFTGGETVTLALDGRAVGTDPVVVTAATDGTFSATVVVPPWAVSGDNTIMATGLSSRNTALIVLHVTAATQTTWYFANGSTRAGQDTRIALLNPNGVPATVHVSFLFTSGAPVRYTTTLHANSRATLDVGTIVGPGRDVFSLVTADRPIGAEQTIYRAGKDFSSAIGVAAPLRTWYLAEGYTGLTFHEYIRILNPGLVTAHVALRLLPFNGRKDLLVPETIDAQRGLVVDVRALAPGLSLSAIVASDQPVVVDRLLTYGRDQYGATEQTGIDTPANTWLFAEGSTLNRFETFLTVLNPSTSLRATVTATFFDTAGRVLGDTTIVVDPRRRGNIKLNDVVHAGAIATILSSTVPVVAERPLYFGAPNSATSGGSVVAGRNGGGLRWEFPEGSTQSGYREFLLLQNPDAQPASLAVDVYGTEGRILEQTLLVPPRGRATLDMRRGFPALPAGVHGSVVRSLNGVPIIVEQSIYSDDFMQGDGTAGIAQ